MRKRLGILLLLVALSCIILACSKEKAEKAKEPVKEVVTQPEGVEKPEVKPEEKPEEKQGGAVKVTIFFSNEDASDFKQEEIEIPSLTPQILVDNLSDRGVITPDVKVLDCKEVQVDGVKALELNLSETFSTYLGGLGTASEYITMGSICNTFIKAYNCEKILITAEGETLTSGHAEYPSYMSLFKN